LYTSVGASCFARCHTGCITGYLITGIRTGKFARRHAGNAAGGLITGRSAGYFTGDQVGTPATLAVARSARIAFPNKGIRGVIQRCGV